MPLQDGLLIAVKDGVVELTANLIEPHRDEPTVFSDALQQRLADHQYQAMTDDAIMSEDLGLASCIVCRDPVPDPLKEPLVSSGFIPEETPGGGQQPRSLFGRLSGTKQRARLEKWSVKYTRSAQVDPHLGGFEATLVEDVPEGPLSETADEAAAAVIDAARTYFRLLLAPRLDSLQSLEGFLDKLRRQQRARWVLHPSAVKGIAAYVALCLLAAAPSTQWSHDPDDDNPLWVTANGGRTIETDPEYRVVQFVRRGLRAPLTEYVAQVVRQSQNR